jgi:hypothetical protein
MTTTAVAQSESDSNLTPSGSAGRRARWMRRPARPSTRIRAHLPAPVGLDPLPERRGQGRGHLARGCPGSALHGFPRQQRPPHRLRASPAEAGDRRADGGAALRAAPLRLRAGDRAGDQARRDRARATCRRCCSRPAARTRSRWRSSWRASPRAVQGAVVLGLVPRRGAGCGLALGRDAVPLGPGRLLDAGHHPGRPLRLLPLPVWPRRRRGRPARPRAACRMACAGMVEYVLEREGDVAAIIAEPARAVPYLPPPGFWQRVREACDRHGVLLIFDEIPTGLGKTGRMFACEHDGVTPDILVLGKAWAAASCRSRPWWRAPISTSPATGRSATTPTRRTR